MGSSRVNGPPRGRRLGKGRGFGISTLVRTMDTPMRVEQLSESERS